MVRISESFSCQVSLIALRWVTVEVFTRWWSWHAVVNLILIKIWKTPKLALSQLMGSENLSWKYQFVLKQACGALMCFLFSDLFYHIDFWCCSYCTFHIWVPIALLCQASSPSDSHCERHRFPALSGAVCWDALISGLFAWLGCLDLIGKGGEGVFGGLLFTLCFKQCEVPTFLMGSMLLGHWNSLSYSSRVL